MAGTMSVPVIAGLAAGIAFIVIFALFTNGVSSFSPQVYETASSRWIKTTKALEETKAFLDKYPDSKIYTYANVRIVEYHVFDNATSKYADLRIQLAFDNSNRIIFAQVMCYVVDSITGEIANSEATYHERHGLHIDDMAGFLQDARCPSHG
jgi:hypothetical protein